MARNGTNVASAARRDAHAEDTRRALLAAARRSFAKSGYAATSLDDIVGRARLTKGALYHHFESKAAIFEAVYVEMSGELAEVVTRAVIGAGDDAWVRTVAALEAFFEASCEPEYVRIVLRDAPHVLGQIHGRELDQAIGLQLVCQLLEGMRDAGMLPDLSIPAAARILLAATGEIVISMAHSDEPERVRAEGTQVLVTMLDGLRTKARETVTASAPRGSRPGRSRPE
jgi:AcrR family transcriptional regulator